jgi:hypothetical protein
MYQHMSFPADCPDAFCLRHSEVPAYSQILSLMLFRKYPFVEEFRLFMLFAKFGFAFSYLLPFSRQTGLDLLLQSINN